MIVLATIAKVAVLKVFVYYGLSVVAKTAIKEDS